MSAREQHNLRGVPSAQTAETPRHQSKAEELGALLEAHRGERHVVVIQSFPDPDAISSALAHRMIAARYGIECDIAYDGLISHHENVALVELLDIPLGQYCENYIQTQKVTSDSFSGGDLKERSNELRLPLYIVSC